MPARISKLMRNVKNMNKRIPGLLKLALLQVIPFLPLQSLATPVTTVTSVKKLHIPGLWLVRIHAEQPIRMDRPGSQSIPIGDFTFRIYCPTSMIRDISNGAWRPSLPASKLSGYPTGVIQLAIDSACGMP
jgi:hypothetical protein